MGYYRASIWYLFDPLQLQLNAKKLSLDAGLNPLNVRQLPIRAPS